MSSRTKRLYIGVTNDLMRRAWEHKTGELDGFTKRYNIKSLVYYEDYGSIVDAIEREKQLKGWLRRKKVALIGRQSRVGRPCRDVVHRVMRFFVLPSEELRMTVGRNGPPPH